MAFTRSLFRLKTCYNTNFSTAFGFRTDFDHHLVTILSIDRKISGVKQHHFPHL